MAWQTMDLKEDQLFKIWFNDGSSVAETAGGLNMIDRSELQSFSDRLDFNISELLEKGETYMLDDDGEIIGGVLKVKT